MAKKITRDQLVNQSITENALKMMKKRYLYTRKDGTQEAPAEMFHRVAGAMADVEKDYGADAKTVKKFESDFFSILSSREFTPAGRTLTNAGTDTALIA